MRYGLITAALFLIPSFSHAQFSGNSGGLFEPEIGIVNSGIIHDVQATVSADRKYVTMTYRGQNSQLLALSSFAFQTGSNVGGGLIGGGAGGAAGGAAAAAGGAAGGMNAPVTLSPGAGPRILGQRGLTPIVRN